MSVTDLEDMMFSFKFQYDNTLSLSIILLSIPKSLI